MTQNSKLKTQNSKLKTYMINSSLMVGLNQADLQAVVNSYNLEQYYYPTLFPLRETSTLS